MKRERIKSQLLPLLARITTFLLSRACGRRPARKMVGKKRGADRRESERGYDRECDFLLGLFAGN